LRDDAGRWRGALRHSDLWSLVVSRWSLAAMDSNTL
jgi:hypothetical protein